MGFSNTSLISTNQNDDLYIAQEKLHALGVPREENEILENYREEMAKIEKVADGVEDIVNVLPFIQKLMKENEKLKKDVSNCREANRENLGSYLELLKDNERQDQQIKANQTHDTTCMCDVCEKNEKLNEYNAKLVNENVDMAETIRVAIASRLSSWFPDEKMGDNDFAEDCHVADNLTGDDLVNMIDGYALHYADELVSENKKLTYETKELRKWVDRNQDEINRLRDVIDEVSEDDDEEEECRNCGKVLCYDASPEKGVCEDCHDNYDEDTGEYNSNAV